MNFTLADDVGVLPKGQPLRKRQGIMPARAALAIVGIEHRFEARVPPFKRYRRNHHF